MLVRLRQVVLVLFGVGLGFALGSGPFAEWVTDATNMIRMAWSQERAARGPGGTFPILAAGFLLGQGLFLAARQAIARIPPARARRVEHIAAWDPAVQLGTRFGLHRYLEHCTSWASEDPTARTQTLALFKIRGLGRLNEELGTLATTQLLQRIAIELRAASLPDSVSAIRRWFAHYFPQPQTRTLGGLPPARYPARWSGATFCLAFRELDAVQAVTISRNVAEWIRHELVAIQQNGELVLSVVVAVGTAGNTARGLASVAARAIGDSRDLVTALLDPADLRAEAIAQLNGVETKKVTMPQTTTDAPSDVAGQSAKDLAKYWVKSWGIAVGCIAGAWLLLATTSGKGPASNNFPWPESLENVQVVDASGPRTVRLARTGFAPQSAPSWRISELLLIQGNPEDGPYNPFQVHATVTNASQNTYYLSPFDFAAVDASGSVISFDATRTLRMAQGLSGCWLRPGDSWSGWLASNRRADKVVGLRFEPDRMTRVEFTDHSPGSSSTTQVSGSR